jgi:hypothetical protein
MGLTSIRFSLRWKSSSKCPTSRTFSPIPSSGLVPLRWLSNPSPSTTASPRCAPSAGLPSATMSSPSHHPTISASASSSRSHHPNGGESRTRASFISTRTTERPSTTRPTPSSTVTTSCRSSSRQRTSGGSGCIPCMGRRCATRAWPSSPAASTGATPCSADKVARASPSCSPMICDPGTTGKSS